MEIVRSTGAELSYDRAKEVKAFDDTKTGVKGLVDTGIQNIPKMFIRPPHELAEELNYTRTSIQLPVVDLGGIDRSDRHKQIVDEIRNASEKWGFFQVVNHGIPLSTLNDMLEKVRMFNEQDAEVKKAFYSRERTKKVRFNSNYDLFVSRTANWRDTLSVSMLTSDHVGPDEVPAVCRDITMEYIKYVTKLGETLFELLAEALGLKPDYLRAMECDKGRTLVCHYYPACPEPELTMGVSKHTDSTFLTILLEDQTGGLQILHENQWVDVVPIAGGLVVNIGDLLQIISNDKLKSNMHRVVANRVPRVSVVCFFAGRFSDPPKIYSPLKELTSEENPPRYREVLVSDYVVRFYTKGLDEKPGLDFYRL